MRKWRWVTRDVGDPFLVVWLGARKPREHDGYYYPYFSQLSYEVCAREFRRLFGFVLQEGECLKVEFRAKPLERKRR